MNKAILDNRVSYAHALSHVKRVRCGEKKLILLTSICL